MSETRPCEKCGKPVFLLTAPPQIPEPLLCHAATGRPECGDTEAKERTWTADELNRMVDKAMGKVSELLMQSISESMVAVGVDEMKQVEVLLEFMKRLRAHGPELAQLDLS